MKYLLPALVLTSAASSSCMLDLKGMAGSGGSASTSSATGPGGGSTASASGSVTGAGGAGGELATSSASSSSSGTGGSTTGWTRRLKLTLDSGVDVQLDNFAVLVRIEKDTVDHKHTQDKGEDLRFTDDQNKLLDHEIERWEEKGASIVWVKIPALKQSGSPLPTIWMYYGNDKASDGQHGKEVWDSGYRGVWHLGEDGDQFTDSSDPASMKAQNNGNPAGAIQSDGLVGKGRSFDAGKHQYINTNNAAHLAKFTVEVLVRGDNAPSTSKGPNGPLMRDNNYQILWDDEDPFSGSASFNPYSQGWNHSDMKPLNAKTWYYLAATFDGTTLRTYKDGVHQSGDVAANTPQITGYAAKIGRHAIYSEDKHFFTGDVDEVRIADTARSDKWIAAQNKSMRGKLVSFGQEETAGGPWMLP